MSASLCVVCFNHAIELVLLNEQQLIKCNSVTAFVIINDIIGMRKMRLDLDYE